MMSPVFGLDPWPSFGATAVAVLAGVLALHALVYGVLRRVRERAPERLPLRGRLVVTTERPARWTLAVLAARAVWAARPAGLAAPGPEAVGAALYVGSVVAGAWLALAVARAARQALGDRLDVGKADNLSERRVLTGVAVFERVL